jgi:hypothetical protein
VSEKPESSQNASPSGDIVSQQRYADSVRAMLERRRAEQRRSAATKLQYTDRSVPLAELRNRESQKG